MAYQPKRLCIVSRDRLRSGDFVAVLRASLRPEDQLEIIMNRRHGGSSGESDLREDRRCQHVLLVAHMVAHMEDGTVENIPMGALPEPGTYHGTVPTGRSTPVDLRVRVSTGDKRVEVPVRP